MQVGRLEPELQRQGARERGWGAPCRVRGQVWLQIQHPPFLEPTCPRLQAATPCPLTCTYSC